MMSNMFSIFDPSTMILSLNILTPFFLMSIIPFQFWLLMFPLKMISLILMKFIYIELKLLVKPHIIILFISYFSMIFMSNFFGLFPYLFTLSTHLTMSFTLAFPLWVSFLLFNFLNKPFITLAHLVPHSTPFLLTMFMVMIESISNLIRPITLSVRLSANMIAGHLLMTLLNNQFLLVSFPMYLPLIIIQFLLLSLELAVALIQAYVFSILITMYSSEI